MNLNSGEVKIVTSFLKYYFFLSNFYPIVVTYDGIVYPSSEHAFQAQKTHDKAIKTKISLMEKASEARAFGQTIALRKDWEQEKINIMYWIQKSKFSNMMLEKRLLYTQDALLVEGNNWGDKFWGMVMNMNGVFEGLNMLGKILMQVRWEIIDTARDRL
jgi:ribA/ribD-fused uncharacterized protein